MKTKICINEELSGCRISIGIYRNTAVFGNMLVNPVGDIRIRPKPMIGIE
jgi:hypothetical protein